MKNNAFIRGKVPITKEEVRAIALSKLELESKHTFLDIGAGTGSVSIEAAITYPQVKVIAVEHNLEALTLIQANKEKFNVPNLQICQEQAPCEGIGNMESVFIGGTGGDAEGVIKWAYSLLTQGGTLVMNFLLVENFLNAFKLLEEIGLEAIDVSLIQVSKLEALGSGTYFKPLNPIYMIAGRKGESRE